jgi:hypothetical protein
MFQFKEDPSFHSRFMSTGRTTSPINHKGGILIVGANHGIYGSLYRALHAWFIDERLRRIEPPVVCFLSE